MLNFDADDFADDLKKAVLNEAKKEVQKPSFIAEGLEETYGMDVHVPRKDSPLPEGICVRESELHHLLVDEDEEQASRRDSLIDAGTIRIFVVEDDDWDNLVDPTRETDPVTYREYDL